MLGNHQVRFAVALTMAALSGCTASAPPPPGAIDQAIHVLPASASVTSLSEMASNAISDDEAVRTSAIARLRDAEHAGLMALAELHADARQRLIKGERDPHLERVREAFDRVAGQRDAHVSLLFWHTDLESAKRQARISGRPILSLRLLGRLDEELSCANSRFFRVALYANATVAKQLQQDFVLHWQSERPVPVVTIDMGDGRELKRTITGNSIHYVLDASGRPIDALPGLYGPARFGSALADIRNFAKILPPPGDSSRDLMLRGYHAKEQTRLAEAWGQRLQALGSTKAPPPRPRLRKSNAPSAAVAVPLAMPKAMTEAPIVRALDLGDVIPLPSPIESGPWEALVDEEMSQNRLDPQSLALIRAKLGPGAENSDVQIAKFERRMAEDMVQNEYGLHRTLHGWMSLTPVIDDLETLNTRVYADLFLTPRADPWLGLNPGDAFTAIEERNLVAEQAR